MQGWRDVGHSQNLSLFFCKMGVQGLPDTRRCWAALGLVLHLESPTQLEAGDPGSGAAGVLCCPTCALEEELLPAPR